MLNSFYIKNYKLFKELRIDSLKRVNLIIGKNNVGKSSLLEAMIICLCNGFMPYLVYSSGRGKKWNLKDAEDPIKVYHFFIALFNDTVDNSGENTIYIGENEQNAYAISLDRDTLTIQKGNEDKETVHLTDFRNTFKLRLNEWAVNSNNNMIMPFFDTDESDLAENWGRIALSSKEDYVIEGLQIIEKDIEKIAFVRESPDRQKAIVKLRNRDKPFDLRNMGNGVTHILETVLTLVNCENGAMLIDEFETGLHWSVQAELWKIIFCLAYKLNIQIFATTHSRDTLWALQQVALSKEEYRNDTQVIKLKSVPKKGIIKAVESSIADVRETLEMGLEIR
ncbi:MAG: ATP/GTP-binding protein [Desulfococcaceae bacterium]